MSPAISVKPGVLLYIVFLGAFSGLMLTGCVTVRKYPSSWEERENVTTPSQLSGIYDRGVLQFLVEFIELPRGSEYGSGKVQLLLNDSLKYEIRVIYTTTALSNDSIINTSGSEATLQGGLLTSGILKRSSFIPKKGLKLSHHPEIGGQGIPLGVLRDYIILNKDKKGDLIIKNGQRSYGVVWLFFPVIIDEYEWVCIGKDFLKYSSYRLKKKY